MGGFRREFALRHYFDCRGTAPQRRYVAGLLRAADAARLRPVFGFCRSLGRVGWLKERFGGCHVVSLRDPVQQWLSCSSYRRDRGDPKFELNHLAILALAPPDHPAAAVARELALPSLRDAKLSLVFETLRQRCAPLPDRLSYRAFVAVWLLGHLHALEQADLVLDMDLLGADEAYRSRAGRHLAAASGLPVDLEGCRLPGHDAAAVGVDFRALNAEVWATLGCRSSATSLRPAAMAMLQAKLGGGDLSSAAADELLQRPPPQYPGRPPIRPRGRLWRNLRMPTPGRASA